MCRYILPKEKRQCRKKNIPETDYCWLHQEMKEKKTCHYILQKLKRKCRNKTKSETTDYCWLHQENKAPAKKKKKKKEKEVDIECLICYEEFQKKDQLKTCRQCGHRFHINCIVNWGKAKCPLCLKDMRIPKKYRKKLEEKNKELREYINPPPSPRHEESSVFIPTDEDNRPIGTIVVHTPEDVFFTFDEILNQQEHLCPDVVRDTFERLGIYSQDYSCFTRLSSLPTNGRSEVEMIEYALGIVEPLEHA